MANTAFHTPTYAKCFDLATSQVGQTMGFRKDVQTGATIAAGAKVVVSHRGKPVKTYTIGDGLTLDGSGYAVTLSLDGTDYVVYAGHTLLASCSFFVMGNVEITFSLEIIKSYL